MKENWGLRTYFTWGFYKNKENTKQTFFCHRHHTNIDFCRFFLFGAVASPDVLAAACPIENTKQQKAMKIKTKKQKSEYNDVQQTCYHVIYAWCPYVNVCVE